MYKVYIIHFFPVLFWVIILFLIWYIIIVAVIIPKYYKVMRSRVEIEKLFYRNIKEGEYLIKLVKLYFINWIKELINNLNNNKDVSEVLLKDKMKVESEPKQIITEWVDKTGGNTFD